MNKIFDILNLILITAISFSIVNAGYNVVSEKIDGLEKTRSRAVSKKEKRISTKKVKFKPFSEYGSIKTRNLFNTNEDAKQVAPEVEQISFENLEQTKLKLKLLGTITSKGDYNYAIILDLKTRKQDLYKTGKTVQNAIVKQIFREKVILDVNGEDQILEIEKKYNKNDNSRNKRRPGFATKSAKKKTYNSTASSSEQIGLTRSKIDTAFKNVNQLMKQIKIRPHYKDGKPDGIVLKRIKSNSFFTEIGLKSGDILKGVDGEDIQSVDDALKFYQTLKSSKSVALQVERRGSMHDIVYDIDD